MQSYKTNNQITALELRVIDEADTNVGVLSLADALKLAKERGLDLIEISAAAKPPVAKIISYDKFRYQQEKKERKQRAAQKNTGMKQIQISIREAKNDLMMKAGRADEFLGEGHQVEVVMSLRGREKGNIVFAKKKLAEFLPLISVENKIISPIGPGGRGLTVIVARK